MIGLVAHPASPAHADERTERLKQFAQQRLGRPETGVPYACEDGWLADQTGYVSDLTPWAERAGLRRGDRIQAVGDVSGAEAGTWVAALSKLSAPGDRLSITVERSGRPVRLELPCRDHTLVWRGERSIFEAIAAGRWDDCVAAARRMMDVRQRPWASLLRTELECSAEKLKNDKAQPTQQLWQLYYRTSTAELEAARYVPGRLSMIRPNIVSAIDTLARRGLPAQADDLRQQLAAATAMPSTFGKSAALARRQGTAFAVRPDGLLLTAYHVVRGATEISVSCGDGEPIRAVVDKASPTTDLAVLRIARHTPVYLALADRRGPQLGAKVFTVGYPASDFLGAEAKFTEGVINALAGPGGDVSYLQTSAQVHSGNSGGALIDEAGDVVGIVIATASATNFLKGTGSLPQNVNWAIRGALAVALFDPPESPPRAPTREARIHRAVQASCLVLASGPATGVKAK
jgi:S1-C subfamily serine protease